MANNSERRRDYTVSRPVHVIYMTTWVGSIGLLACFGGLVLASLKLSERLGAERLEILGLNGLLVLGVLSLALVVVAIVLGVYCILHTHRMVGASHRIKAVLQAVRRGDRAIRANLREGDYFLDVADELNGLIEELPDEGGPSEAPTERSVPGEESDEGDPERCRTLSNS